MGKCFVMVDPTEVNNSPYRGFKGAIQEQDVLNFVKEYFEGDEDSEELRKVKELLDSECKDLHEYNKIRNGIFGECSVIVDARSLKDIYAYEVDGKKYCTCTSIGCVTSKGWEDYYMSYMENNIPKKLDVFVRNSEGNFRMFSTHYADGMIQLSKYKHEFSSDVITSGNFSESEELCYTTMEVTEHKVLLEALTEGFADLGMLNVSEDFVESFEKFKDKKIECIKECDDKIMVFNDGI